MKEQNKLPVGWKEVELSEIGQIVTGSTPSKTNMANYGGEFPWIKPPNLDNSMYVSKSNEYLSDEGIQKSRILPAGSVLVSCIGNIGKIAISGCDLATNQQINSIIPNKNILPEFLYYDIKKNQERFESSATKAVVPLLNKTNFSHIKIPIPFTPEGHPDLKEQERIVKILEKAERLKEKRKKALKLSDEYLRSVFNEIFGNKSEIKKLKDICNIIMGQSPPGNSYNENREGTPFFQGKAEFTEKYPIIKKWTTQVTKIALPNSILISVRAPVGSVNLCNIKCCIGRGLASMTPKKEITLEYLYSWFKLNEKNISDIGTGSTFKAISSIQLANLKIPVPPLPLQQTFASIVERVERIKERQKQSEKEINNLYEVLMQRAFKGELVR